MICHEKKFVFLHIPKTAGTSVGAAINRSLGIDERYDGPIIHHDDLTKEILQEYFVFTFVRNPWDRLYSQYKFRQWLQHIPFEFAIRHLEELYRIRYNTDVSTNPPDLSTAKLRSDWYAEFTHIPSQVEFLRGKYNDGIDKFPYLNFIGRFENFKQDMFHIARRLELKNFEILHENKSRSRQRYTEIYTDSTKKYVEYMYYEDIEKFKYTFDGIYGGPGPLLDR